MKVYKIQNIPNTQNTQNTQRSAEVKNTPAFKAKTNLSQISKEVAEKSNWWQRFITYLGQNDGEILNIAVTAIGTAIVAPIFIAGNPISKEDKETKWYSAMRQPISAVITVLAQISITKAFNNFMEKASSLGHFGEVYDLRAMPQEKYLKRIIKKEHPEFNKEQIKNEITRRQQLAQREVIEESRVSLRNKQINGKDLLSKDALDKAEKELVKEIEEIKEKTKAELKGKKSRKDIRKTIEQKINAAIEERAIKNVEKSVEFEAKSKFKIRELAEKFSSLDDAIKHVTETMQNNKTEEKLMNNVLDRLETIQHYEQANNKKAFSSVKNLGKTYEEVLHNVKIKQLVKSKVSDAAKAFKTVNKIAGIPVTLITLPLTCGLLNWSYPRIMEKIMPILQPLIHRKDPDWTPEKAKKYGPPEKSTKIEKEDHDD